MKESEQMERERKIEKKRGIENLLQHLLQTKQKETFQIFLKWYLLTIQPADFISVRQR